MSRGAVAVACLIAAAGLGGRAKAQETDIQWRGAPQFSGDGWTFKVRGRAYFDYVHQDVDFKGFAPSFTADNSRLRTGRLGVEGTWTEQFAYKAEVDFVGGDAVWRDLYLEYMPADGGSLLVGNFRTFSLENITSSRFITFMERGAFNDAIDADRVMNLGGRLTGENWSIGAFLNGDSVNDDDVEEGDDAQGVSARGTFAPMLGDARLHLGAWTRFRDIGQDASIRYRVRNNTNYGDRYVDTGSLLIEKDMMWGLESALVAGPFSLQGEYAHTEADTETGDHDGDAWYAYGSWFITGESRNYDPEGGEFGRTKVLRPVTDGGRGAWELGLRYDNVDLSDFGTATSGEYSAWTVGVNWYPFAYVRFMANYTDSENDNFGELNDVDVQTFQMRAQFDF